QAKRQELDKWLAHTHGQQQVLELRQQHRWLSFKWWRALFQGRVEERLKEFQCRSSEAGRAVTLAEEQITELNQNRESESQRHGAALAQIVASETANRVEVLNRRLGEAIGELDKCRERWLQARAEMAWRDRLTDAPDLEQLEKLRKQM